MIDQFISSALSKWRETSRLTLLLPHGYEGNGPEHSSARLERFLQLGAQENIRVVNCTTAAQYFHLLRRQALDATARALVVMTPKGLLRLKDAASSPAELARGRFEAVLDDTGVDKSAVRRLVLCSGKVYFDLIAHEAHTGNEVAVARVEQLYPFPTEATAALVASYPNLTRSSGRRRSRRTWGRGARSAIGSRKRLRGRRFATSDGRGGRARPRAIRRRTGSSRTASPAPP